MTRDTHMYAEWPIPEDRGFQLYDLEPARVSERSVRALAGRFGMPTALRQARLEIDADKISVGFGSQVLSVYRASGSLRYQDLARWQMDSGTEVRLSDDEAIAVAEKVIRDLDLAPEGEYRAAKVTHLRAGSASSTGDEIEERTIDAGVIFIRVVDGVPVDGPGGKLTVYLGAGGEPTGVDKTWRPIAGIHETVEAIRSPEAVLEAARRFHGLAADTELLESHYRFGYFEDGARVRQRILQPAFVLMLATPGFEGRPGRRAVFVQAAATNSIGSLQPVRRRRGPLPPRPQDRERLARG